MAEERCAKCGNAARFNVVVTHPHINGQWVRLACSRNCAALLVDDGSRELRSQTNGAGTTGYAITPMLSGADTSIRVK